MSTDYRVAGYGVVAKTIQMIATDESVTLTAPNGSSMFVNTPEARLSVIAGALEALIRDIEKYNAERACPAAHDSEEDSR
jgi:hypothetical protein